MSNQHSLLHHALASPRCHTRCAVQGALLVPPSQLAFHVSDDRQHASLVHPPSGTTLWSAAVLQRVWVMLDAEGSRAHGPRLRLQLAAPSHPAVQARLQQADASMLPPQPIPSTGAAAPPSPLHSSPLLQAHPVVTALHHKAPQGVGPPAGPPAAPVCTGAAVQGTSTGGASPTCPPPAAPSGGTAGLGGMPAGDAEAAALQIARHGLDGLPPPSPRAAAGLWSLLGESSMVEGPAEQQHLPLGPGGRQEAPAGARAGCRGWELRQQGTEQTLGEVIALVPQAEALHADSAASLGLVLEQQGWLLGNGRQAALRQCLALVARFQAKAAAGEAYRAGHAAFLECLPFLLALLLDEMACPRRLAAALAQSSRSGPGLSAVCSMLHAWRSEWPMGGIKQIHIRWFAGF